MLSDVCYCEYMHIVSHETERGENMNKRLNITISAANFEKLQVLANRYGVTANSLVTVIVGQWLDDMDAKVERLPFEVANKAYLTDRKA